MEKLFLMFCAVFWMGYGALCLVFPEIPAGFIGYQMVSADALIEVAAMYGGLEFGLGCMFFYFAMEKSRYQTGLLLVIFTIGALALSRTVAFLMIGGDIGVYTKGGIAYEGLSGLIATVLYFRHKSHQGRVSAVIDD